MWNFFAVLKLRFKKDVINVSTYHKDVQAHNRLLREATDYLFLSHASSAAWHVYLFALK